MTDIIVEDGSGVDGANSYTTISGVDEYCSSYGYTDWTASTDEVKKVAMFKSKRYIDNLNWRGIRVNAHQSSAFPRYNLFNDEGRLVGTDNVPINVVDSFCEAAVLSLPTSDINLEPILVKEDFSVSESIGGVISTSYSGPGHYMIPKSTIIKAKLKGLLKSNFLVEIERG